MNKTCGECKYFVTNEGHGGCCTFICDAMCDDDRACYKFQKPTNGDVIRQMSNEELAELFALNCMCDTCPLKDVECVGDGETERTYAHCYDKFNSYLNAPAESEAVLKKARGEE